MQFVILKLLQGPETGKKVTIRAGQRVHVGRSPRADFHLARDPDLSEFHFMLDCTRGLCDFQLIEGSTPGVFGDQELISETLYDGEQFQIGSSIFGVEIVGQTVSRPIESEALVNSPAEAIGEESEPAPPARSGFVKVECETAAIVLDKMTDPPDELVDLQEDGETPRDFFEKLIAAGFVVPALQFLTHALPKREAVWALASAIEKFSGESLSPKETTALEVTKTWAAEPTEEHRREAEVQANLLKQKSPTGFAVQAAFWSEGSMGPVDGPDIPVLEPLCANMVATGVVKLALRQDDYPSALQQLLEHWTAVADGELTWDS